MQLKKRLIPMFITSILASSVFATEVQIATKPIATNTTLSAPPQQPLQQKAPRIQIAILLDTSNSMDGLIDQARNQLWQMVDEFSKARKDGKPPVLEVAVFEYGNDNLSSKSGHIRQVTGLTRELDRVSEALFALTTNGGSEYCGYAIQTAVQDLQWSNQQGDLRAIFIAGNEPFTQGPIAYTEAIKLAKEKDINVSTIFAGQYQKGISSGWQNGAVLAGGNYMSIDHNQQIAHIQAPQDQKIAELNSKLNQTYIPYGAEGEASAQRQIEQDRKSREISVGLLAKRAKSKASTVYNNSQWDLVDAIDSGKVSMDDLDSEALPAPMAAMSPKEQETFIEEKKDERKKIKAEIAELAKERDKYVAAEKQKQTKSETKTMSDVLTDSIRVQSGEKAFSFQ